jgi:hypothetical protein
MKASSAVIATDVINRQLTQIPLSSLVFMVENMLEESVRARIAVGMPMNNSHDHHMPVGWSIPRGVYVSKDMGRLLALILTPESADDRQVITRHRTEFRANLLSRQAEPYAAGLRERLGEAAPQEGRLRQCEAVAIQATGLAATIAPEFFSAGSAIVDKDGLVDYSALLERTRQLAPGVFHWPSRDVILFAHPFFRRSLSRENSLNSYVLRSFDEAAALREVRGRLRLDPDLVGHPDSVTPIMELEYWNGPPFSDDIETIPSGVTEHGATEKERFYSQIDRTQIWWKAEEQRGSREAPHSYRTFEVEELILRASAGLADESYGCRYAHSEYDLARRMISHFDGAIRAYDLEAYIERLDLRIDRAGKRAAYQKLFRLDGAIPVLSWKQVLTDYFRGNHLVPEYLGATVAADNSEEPSQGAEEPPSSEPDLSFFVGLHATNEPPPRALAAIPDRSIDHGGTMVPIVEIGPGSLGETFLPWVDRERCAMLCAHSPVVNLSPVALPGFPPHGEAWRDTAARLSESIRAAAEEDDVQRISVSIRWQDGNVVKVVAFAGLAVLVAGLLERATDFVRPDEVPSTWVESLRDAMAALAPDLASPARTPDSAAFDGRLELQRPSGIEFSIALPRTPESTSRSG